VVKKSEAYPLGNSPTRISPEGAARCGENRLRTLEPDSVRISSPFRAKCLFSANPGVNPTSTNLFNLRSRRFSPRQAMTDSEDENEFEGEDD
jgi:hypothetical protein